MEKGESWDDGYFRERILTERVILFLNDPENVLLVGEAVFLHDKAPCMRAGSDSAAVEGQWNRILG